MAIIKKTGWADTKSDRTYEKCVFEKSGATIITKTDPLKGSKVIIKETIDHQKAKQVRKASDIFEAQLLLEWLGKEVERLSKIEDSL